ncbi:right-handed parallel beta-helix repeat-containing protein [Lysobacter tyrosinilyticus]
MKTARYIAIGLILATSAILASASFAQSPARAARSFDHCTGFIDTLPTTISTPGTWCLRRDLATAITSGRAIVINSDNVTIDCNHFTIDGLAAGPDSRAGAIFSEDRRHITVRQCKVRGFGAGVDLSANFLSTGGGHLVEDNQFDLNIGYGLQVIGGEKSVVRSNILRDNGGQIAMVMIGFIDIIDNTVIGSVGTGILVYLNTAGSVSGNRVRDVARVGIRVSESGASLQVSGNHLNANPGHFPGGFSTIGIQCGSEELGPVFDNLIVGFDSPVMQCNAFDNTIPRSGHDTP